MEETQANIIPPETWKKLFISAIFVDAVQIAIGLGIPFLGAAANMIINIFYGLPLSFYMHRRGISMIKGKNLGRLLATFGIDEVTLGFAPAWKINLYLTYSTYQKEAAAASSFKRFVAKRPKPLYENGVRQPRKKVEEEETAGEMMEEAI